MKLRRNVAGVQVKDKAYGGRVFAGDSKVEAASCTGFPFWYLMAVLEHWV
jgi:hypothetical protein